MFLIVYKAQCQTSDRHDDPGSTGLHFSSYALYSTHNLFCKLRSLHSTPTVVRGNCSMVLAPAKHWAFHRNWDASSIASPRLP